MSSPCLDDPRWDAVLDELAWTALLAQPPAPSSTPWTASPTSPSATSLGTAPADHRDLSVPERIDLLVQVQREVCRLAALEADLLVSLIGVRPVEREVLVLDRSSDTERTIVLTDEMREELAFALHRSAGQVHGEVSVARLLAGPLRATRDALADGAISPRHARVIAEQAQRLEPHLEPAAFADACLRLEHRVLTRASDLTAAQTRTLARRAVEAIDRDAARRRREAARREVGVDLRPCDDGLALVQACLPITDAMRLHAAVEARAREAGEDSSCGATIGERRAAALLDLVLADPGTCVAAEIAVVVDLPTLLGLDDHVATAEMGTGEPLDASAVRALLADPRTPVRLRRLVTDPMTGALIDRGRRGYEVTDAMRAFLVARDGTCRFPGCTRRAERCQMDHAIPWEDGGASDRDNLGPLCTRHHQLKTHGGWELSGSAGDGSCAWTSPHGRTRVLPPRRLLPEPEPPPSVGKPNLGRRTATTRNPSRTTAAPT